MSEVELVKSKINILDIINEYVKLTKVGNNFKANCPFHQEKTPSFIVNEERQTYHCFGCNQGGDALTFLMEIENIDFKEALKILADRSGVDLKNNLKKEDFYNKNKNEKLYLILELAKRFYSKQLYSNNKNKILKYLRDRGISDDLIKKFNLGFAPNGWHFLEDFLNKNNFFSDDIFDAGVLVKKDSGGFYDRFRNRIIFPIADSFGKTIGFTARILPGQNDSHAKYINTPESVLYHKSEVLYGLNLAKKSIKEKDQVIIMEGNMDVIASWQAGVTNVVAISGTALTKNQINILKRYTRNFILFFDSDQAGIEAMKRSARICLLEDINTSALILNEGKDAADIVKDNPDNLKKIIENSENIINILINLLIKQFNLDIPREKRLAVEEIADFLSKISNSIEREDWINKCSDIFNVDEKNIFDLVERNKIKENKNKNTINLMNQREIIVGNEIFKKSRLYNLYKSVALMMFAFPKIWQYVYENKYKFQIFQEHVFLKKLIDEGFYCNFKSENFVNKNLNSEILYKESLLFKQNYEVNNSVENIFVDLEDLLKNIILEKKKNEIDDLTNQLKKAEKLGHYEEKNIILEKISKISIN